MPQLVRPEPERALLFATGTVAGAHDDRARTQPWFDNARRLRELLTDLEERSLRAFRDAEDPAL